MTRREVFLFVDKLRASLWSNSPLWEYRSERIWGKLRTVSIRLLKEFINNES